MRLPRYIIGTIILYFLMIISVLSISNSVYAFTPPGGGLESGTYQVDTWAAGRYYPSTWKIEVNGGIIRGTSEWDCCPGKRTDLITGEVDGRKVTFERHCSGQGAGCCYQVFTGSRTADAFEGTFTHNEGPGGTWKLYLRGRTAPVQGDTGFGSAKIKGKALKGEIYYIDPGTSTLPDFNKLKPVGTVFAKTLNIQPAKFGGGLPGIPERREWFAIRYRGSFRIERPGYYTFMINSDDGTRLLIDGRLLINNDGVHQPREAKGFVPLDTGTHSIEVQYFNGADDNVALQVFWTVPGGKGAVFEPEYVDAMAPAPSVNEPAPLETYVFSCEEGGNEEGGCCCFKEAHTYRRPPQYVEDITAVFDTGNGLGCRSKVDLQTDVGDGKWKTLKTLDAVSSTANDEFAPIEATVSVREVISAFRIYDRGGCFIDYSRITVRTR